MMRSGILKNSVLGIILFVYTSVQSLETGYKDTGKHIKNEELYMDLKCGYLFGGYTQMRLVRDLLEIQKTKWKGIIGPVGSLSSVVRPQIISLFGLKVKRIGAMWALYLFTSLLMAFYQDSKNTPDWKIIETVSYVIEKLENDIRGCRKDNSFDFYESILKSGQKLELYTYSTTILPQYLEQANAQLAKNNILSYGSLKESLDVSIKINSLLMMNLGMNDKMKYDFQNVYNLQITWNNTSPILNTAWGNARGLDWKNTNLRHIKSYCSMCNDFFKIILFRLSLKHIAYLRPYIGNLDLYKVYVQQWYNIVVQFGTILNLSGDLNVTILLDCLIDLINQTRIIDNVVIYIVSTLNKLCEPFKCQASASFVIDNQEIKINYTNLNEKEINSLPMIFSPVPIEFNSLLNANRFLSHLNLTFRYVDFSVIRSLTDFIDELNSKNDAESSDASTKGFEHLYINMADYS